MSRRFALVIGTSEYEDANLSQLLNPNVDVERLAETLRSPSIGSFDEVIELVNRSFADVFASIADFFADKKPEDLLMLYFSGHGILDDQGRLYLAVKNTRYNRVSGTAISSTFINDEMQRSLSKRQVLILDCCHSGAFSRGRKGRVGIRAVTPDTFNVGYGRVVITATDATQYAWEGKNIIGQAENSLFTYFLVYGLQTGEADTNNDGKVTVDELYDYLYQQIKSTTTKQTPTKFSYGEQGDIIIAKNPDPQKSLILDLPPELQLAIVSTLPKLRDAAIHELSSLLESDNFILVNSAEYALRSLVKDQDHEISLSAVKALESHGKPIGVGTGEVVGPIPPTQNSSAALLNRIKITDPFMLELTLIPDRETWIGSDEFENEKPRHRVYISDFFVSTLPITTKQFHIFAEDTNYSGPLANKGHDLNSPVTFVSWYAAIGFCEWLSIKSGKTFRLPTEAEWEKMAGQDTTILLDLNKPTNEENVSPNAMILYQYLGEWCFDWYDEKEYLHRTLSSKIPKDPTGPRKGIRRVVRGNNLSSAGTFRLTSRSGFYPVFWFKYIGFRVVMQVDD